MLNNFFTIFISQVARLRTFNTDYTLLNTLHKINVTEYVSVQKSFKYFLN